MSVEITRENFTHAMREAVAERGEDWVYPKFPGAEANDSEGFESWHNCYGVCQYMTSMGNPACIIGLALYKIDPSLPAAYCRDGEEDASVLLRSLGVSDELLCTAAIHAQNCQDNGVTWGEALAKYLEIMESSDEF